MLQIIRRLVLLIGLLLGSLAGESYAAGKIRQCLVDGIVYGRAADLWAFYKFTPRQGREGFHSYGSGKLTVSFKPGRQDFYVNSYRYILSYPVREEAGQMLISSVDMAKLVDPIVRVSEVLRNKTVRTVVIDPGHGGHDAGAVSPYAREKDCNLAVGLKLKKRLEHAGFKVVMTRKGDYFLTLQQRVEIANKIPDCIFVSIHHNSGRQAAHGIETFTLAPHGTTSPFAKTRRYDDLAGNKQDIENIALATAVHSRAIKASGAVDRGIQRARFSVLCTIKCPAILFEGGFVSNPTEGSKITTDSYQNMLADSICEGILNYNGVQGGLRRTNKTGASSVSGSRGARINGSNEYRGTTRLK